LHKLLAFLIYLPFSVANPPNDDTFFQFLLLIRGHVAYLLHPFVPHPPVLSTFTSYATKPLYAYPPFAAPTGTFSTVKTIFFVIPLTHSTFLLHIVSYNMLPFLVHILIAYLAAFKRMSVVFLGNFLDSWSLGPPPPLLYIAQLRLTSSLIH
jgi:hypothetical protein